MCYLRTFRKISVWIALIACGLCIGFGGSIAEKFGYGLFGALIGCAVGGFIFGQTATRAALPYVRSAVAHQNANHA